MTRSVILTGDIAVSAPSPQEGLSIFTSVLGALLMRLYCRERRFCNLYLHVHAIQSLFCYCEWAKMFGLAYELQQAKGFLLDCEQARSQDFNHGGAQTVTGGASCSCERRRREAPSDLGVWGSVVSSPSGVWGGAPAANAFYLSIYEIYIAPLQGNYSEALPAQARAKIKVLRSFFRATPVANPDIRLRRSQFNMFPSISRLFLSWRRNQSLYTNWMGGIGRIFGLGTVRPRTILPRTILPRTIRPRTIRPFIV